jgi:hypothetical protein
MQGRADEADEIERRLKSVQETLNEEPQAWFNNLKTWPKSV